MINARWLGGPHDGEEITLQDECPFDMPFLDPDSYTATGSDELNFCFRTFVPEVVGGRWVVRWRESA